MVMSMVTWHRHLSTLLGFYYLENILPSLIGMEMMHSIRSDWFLLKGHLAINKSHVDLALFSTTRALHSVALALSQGSAVLLEGINLSLICVNDRLEGPLGCGKTSLVDECARITGNTDIVRYCYRYYACLHC